MFLELENNKCDKKRDVLETEQSTKWFQTVFLNQISFKTAGYMIRTTFSVSVFSIIKIIVFCSKSNTFYFIRFNFINAIYEFLIVLFRYHLNDMHLILMLFSSLCMIQNKQNCSVALCILHTIFAMYKLSYCNVNRFLRLLTLYMLLYYIHLQLKIEPIETKVS